MARTWLAEVNADRGTDKASASDWADRSRSALWFGGLGVDLWRLSPSCVSLDWTEARSWLSPDEIARARTYHHERDRRRFLVRRAWLRKILGSYLAVEPGRIQFHVGSFGKPLLAGWPATPIAFNVSHAGDESLVVVSQSGNPGVDLERIEPIAELEAMAGTCLSPGESALWDTLPAGDRLAWFYRVWTCKEAYLKALGIGLSQPLTTLGVTLPEGCDDGLAGVNDALRAGGAVAVHSFTPLRDHVAAVAWIAT